MFFARVLTKDTPFIYSQESLEENVGDVITLSNIVLAPSSKVQVYPFRTQPLCSWGRPERSSCWALSLTKTPTWQWTCTSRWGRASNFLSRATELSMPSDSLSPSLSWTIWTRSNCITCTKNLTTWDMKNPTQRRKGLTISNPKKMMKRNNRRINKKRKRKRKSNLKNL